MFMFACVCLSVVPFPLVEDGVIEEENELEGYYCEPEYEGQYRAQEPEAPYRELELPESFEDGKSNLFPLDHIYPSFQTQPVEA